MSKSLRPQHLKVEGLVPHFVLAESRMDVEGRNGVVAPGGARPPAILLAAFGGSKMTISAFTGRLPLTRYL
jgi:hypothetical protein